MIRKGNLLSLNLNSPIPQVSKTNEKLSNRIDKLNLVPYAGSSKGEGQGYLGLLTDLPNLSPTHGACISFKINNCFNGSLEIVNKRKAGLKYKESQEALSIDEQEQILDVWENAGIDLAKFQDITKQLAKQYEATGMAYLNYKEVTVGDTKKVYLNALDANRTFYVRTEDMQVNMIAYSKYWTVERTVDRKDIEIIREYPAFTRTGNVNETVITFKNESPENDWYGRPDSVGALYSMVTEWMLRSLNLKVVSTETVSKLLMLMMREKPGTIKPEQEQDNFEEYKAAIRPVISNEGSVTQSKSVGMLSVPYHEKGIQFMTEKLEVNRDVNHRVYSRDTAKDDIHGQHRIPPELTTSSQVKSSIGGSYLKDLYVITDETVISPMQSDWENRMCIVFDLMHKFLEDDTIKGKSIKFDKNIDRIIEKLSDDKAEPVAEQVRNDDTGGDTRESTSM